MIHVKRYIMLAVVLILMCIAKFREFGVHAESVDTFRGASLIQEDFNPLIADSINEQLLSIQIDSNTYTNSDSGIYMDDNLNLMFPVTLLTEGLNCSSHLYEDYQLLVEKRTDSLTMVPQSETLIANGEEKPVTSKMREREGIYYVSFADISENIGYSYNWNMEKNQAVAVDQYAGTSILPSSFDLRERRRVGAIKNQGSSGTCWAFAALSAMESELLPFERLSLSVDHMFRENSFAVNENDGGEYTMGMAYLLSWQGPVYEEQDPFGDGVSTSGLTAVKHVQEVQMMEAKNYPQIKEAVFKYGGVQTALYSTLVSSSKNNGFYNSEKNAYCYIGTEKPNHEIVIVGWDDNYPKENFPINVEGNGAFICQNSWGSGFGDKGYFYVSYYDTNIGSHNLVYTNVEEIDNYDHIYQSDLCGWVGQMGFGKSSIYGANVYTATSQQKLKSAGFYAIAPNTDYQLFVVKDFKDKTSLQKMKKVAEGKLLNAGYYTINFNQGVNVEDGEKYAVVLYINTPDSVHPMAIEYMADKATETVDLTDGEGYVSSNGNKWDRVEETSAANLCLKVYAKDR